MGTQQTTSFPQAVNKAFTVTWYLLEPIMCYLIFPPSHFTVKIKKQLGEKK